MDVLNVPFWAPLVHFRMQVLQVEDLPALHQQGLNRDDAFRVDRTLLRALVAAAQKLIDLLWACVKALHMQGPSKQLHFAFANLIQRPRHPQNKTFPLLLHLSVRTLHDMTLRYSLHSLVPEFSQRIMGNSLFL